MAGWFKRASKELKNNAYNIVLQIRHLFPTCASIFSPKIIIFYVTTIVFVPGASSAAAVTTPHHHCTLSNIIKT